MFRNLITIFCSSVLSASVASSAIAADSAADFAKQMDGYLANEANVEKVANSLQQLFIKKQQQQQEAQAKAEQDTLEDQFKNPVKIEVGNSAIKGNPKASITLVEFSDFQCPFCKRGADTMAELLKAYPNDVKLIFKHYPLPFHDKAKPASIAALAAGEQGKFWEMHDLLFSNQQSLTEEQFVKFAGDLKLDVKKFQADLKNPKLAAQIDADMKLAQELGVQGTPGFFVNGVAVRGARPVPYFKNIIDRWLEISKADKPAAAKDTKKDEKKK